MNTRQRTRPQPVKKNIIKASLDGLLGVINEEIPANGFSLAKDIRGEIISVSLAPSESKTIPHGLKVKPLYRLILRQTGNAVITDVDDEWTEKTIGLKNNSATDTVVLTLMIIPE